jgi:alkylation response protein AidB-like acyl-CoA dehydrogenase
MTSIDQDLASSIAAFADSARDFLSTSPLGRLRESGGAPRFDRTVWHRIGEAGWPGILVPEDLGGLGLDLRHAAAIAEQVGRHPLPEPFIAAAVHPAAVLGALPAGGLRDQLLGEIAASALMVGVAWQENAGEIGANPAPGCRARTTKDGWELIGTKRWVVPGDGADGWLVWTAIKADAGLFWLPASTPGLRVVDVERVDASSMATLTLNACNLPAANLIGRGADALAAVDQGNDAARLMQAAELLGIARATFDLTLDYLKTREQFGKPIGANQALQHRMVDAYIAVELAIATLAEVQDGAEPLRVSAAAASRAKARCAHTAALVTHLAIQLHGAIGFTDECDIGLFHKRALQLASWLGGVTPHRLRALTLSQRGEDGPAASPAGDAGAAQLDWETCSEDEFRTMVRAFVRTHYPEKLRHPARRLRWYEVKDWYLTLSRKGWLAPAWPKEHGGMALAPGKLLAYIDEMEDWGVARMPDQGLINLGPVLIRYGNREQQQRFLPKILSGEHVWCQGYSEPNAGSDLAALRMEAVPDGDFFVVSGQKTWTTLAQDATHIFLLVRTDKTVKKQAGISFLLAELSAPGVTVRPIRNIAGEEEFCEVFFDKVRVPKENLVGGLNQGWNIAKALLGFERLFVGSPKTSQYALGLLRNVARARGLFADAHFAARFAELELDTADLRALYGEFAEIVKRGDELPANVSILKIWATETYTRIASLLVEACNEDGTAAGEVAFGDASVNPLAPKMNATITTIYGGTNEIQRNILAKVVLDLPS